MFNRHQISNRLATFAGLAVLALLMTVPNAFAMPEGGGRAAPQFVPAAFAMPEGGRSAPMEQALHPQASIGETFAPAFVPGTTPHTPTHIADTTSSSLDLSGAFIVVLIGLALLLAVVAARHAASRRSPRLLVR